MKQKYELGTAVWAFKQEGQGFVKTSGIVKKAEINSGGYVQYEVAAGFRQEDGSIKELKILANHASMAETEQEIDSKIRTYHIWEEAQKANYNKTFGAPEYDLKEIDAKMEEMADNRGK